MANEHDIIKKCQAGDLNALGELFEMYRDSVVRTAYGILRRRELAEDVTQQVFVKLFDAISTYDPKRAFKPWIQRIAVYTALDETKKRKWKDLPLDEMVERPSHDDVPQKRAEQSELRDAMWAAMAKLSPDHRAVVVLRYYQEFNEQEMSEALKIRRGPVKSRLYNAMRNLEKILAEESPDLVEEYAPSKSPSESSSD